MHIVYLTHEYPKKHMNGGGIGSFVQFIGRKLVLQGIRVSVVGINNTMANERETDMGVEVYRLSKTSWKFAKFYDNTKRILKKIEALDLIEKVDVVEGSELNFAFFPKITSYKKNIRLHGGHHFFSMELNKKPALWRGFQEKKSFKNADHFIAVTDYVGYKTQKYINLNFEYTTIHNGINLDNFFESDVTKEIPFKLLFIGTVCEKKGIKQLIEALPLILKVYPKTTLEIIGRDWISKEGESYVQFLKTEVINDLSASIKFTGGLPYSELPKHIESAHVCVYPSFAESFGLTLIEGMAMGKLVAASTISPFKEIVGNNKLVAFFNPNNKIEISDEIVSLLASDKNHLKLRQSARNHILTTFCSKDIITKNIQFYKKIQ